MIGGVQVRGQTRHKEAVKAKARQLWQMGMSAGDIARSLGLDYNYGSLIKRWCDPVYRERQNELAKKRRTPAPQLKRNRT